MSTSTQKHIDTINDQKITCKFAINDVPFYVTGNKEKTVYLDYNGNVVSLESVAFFHQRKRSEKKKSKVIYGR